MGAFPVACGNYYSSTIPRHTNGGCRIASIYPNPCTVSAALRLAGPRAGLGKVIVFDTQGRSVVKLEVQRNAPREISWELRDESGALVRTGLYFLGLENMPLTERRALLVLR